MKFLIIRFSSIGDIVLTTAVLRAIREKYPEAEVHYLTKESMKSVLENHPNIHYLWTWENRLPDGLKQISFDAIFDLHHNLRTFLAKRQLQGPKYVFRKETWNRFLLVQFGIKRTIPHVVSRYLKTLKPIGIEGDFPLDFPIHESTDPARRIPELRGVTHYRVMVMGAAHVTKMIPLTKMESWMNDQQTWVLLGGKQEQNKAELLAKKNPHHWLSLAGKLTIQESAWVMKYAQHVVVGDTGMMHIASALQVPTTIIWGGTTPELGMGPWMNPNAINIEVENLDCRPCSKMGKNQCPKGHFKCMMNQPEQLPI